MSCCDTEMKHTICLCFFTKNTVILPHVLHSFNLTILKPKLWKYHTFCTISKPKLWYYHTFYRVSEPKLWYPYIFTFSTPFEAKTVICLHFLHTCEATNWYYHTFCTVWNLKLWYDHMFCIVFEPKLWYYHQFFIVWKSNLWCFCILCVVLEAKLWNYHMFWHYSSIFHKVDHHFIMNMLFFLQFLHIFDPNYRPPPSVNWKFAVVSWLLGSHLHLKYGTSHAEKKKTWLSPQCCANQRQKA